MNLRAWSNVMLSLAAPVLLPASAAAQQVTEFLGSDIPFDLQRGEVVTVVDRPHPELEPLGINAGSMILFPALTTAVGYTTNVYGQSSGAVADGFTTVKPEFALISQWSRNFFEVTGSGDFKRYFSQSARNETAIRCRLTVASTWALMTTSSAWSTASAGSRSNIPALSRRTRPVQSATIRTDATVRGTFEFNRVRVIASGRVNDLVFSNTVTLTDQLLNQQYRNRTEYHSAVRVEYSFNPDIAVFTEGSFIRSDYHVGTVSQPLRNNNATRFLAGGNFDLGKLIRGTIGIGYENHQYDLSFYLPIKGIAFDAQLQWLPTDLTTVNFQATRKVEDSINLNSPGFFASLAQLRVDHELLRYVLLFAEGTYERDSFVALARRDTQYEFHGGATYSLGRHFKLVPSVWYIDRKSVGTFAGPTFTEVRGTMGLFTQW